MLCGEPPSANLGLRLLFWDVIAGVCSPAASAVAVFVRSPFPNMGVSPPSASSARFGVACFGPGFLMILPPIGKERPTAGRPLPSPPTTERTFRLRCNHDHLPVRGVRDGARGLTTAAFLPPAAMWSSVPFLQNTRMIGLGTPAASAARKARFTSAVRKLCARVTIALFPCFRTSGCVFGDLTP